jgi:hypothetical protein
MGECIFKLHIKLVFKFLIIQQILKLPVNGKLPLNVNSQLYEEVTFFKSRYVFSPISRNYYLDFHWETYKNVPSSHLSILLSNVTVSSAVSLIFGLCY